MGLSTAADEDTESLASIIRVVASLRCLECVRSLRSRSWATATAEPPALYLRPCSRTWARGRLHRDLSSAKHGKKRRSLLVENGRITDQLPAVQEVFAEAFIDLQRQLGEESALAFTAGVATNSNDDPLAALLETSNKTGGGSMPPMLLSSSFRRSSSSTGRKKKGDKLTRPPANPNDDFEGGFLRDRDLPEEFSRLQRPESLETYARKMHGVEGAAPAQASQPSAGTPATTENPYRRRKRPRQNLWNQVLESQAPDQRHGKGVPKMNFDQMERAMIDDITDSAGGDGRLCPSCGSASVDVRSGVTSKNNDMSKGEVWGRKETDPVVERCCCRNCGKAWNVDA
ncbi:hypothetical protein THAOC_03811 [Thalassiosira oceanica]|uniref:Uncharacterized protein n=1 Tax=Thalassiosira oceanica TaxID=159749 RepID=K0TKD0_THAOC|nr:hypothetical protein THAOC_03811 [Thalassiosira oceanica]|eukprot:EJK74506.1 hypothetical protein THAOC_03811 [Thalassiosira oceanica]